MGKKEQSDGKDLYIQRSDKSMDAHSLGRFPVMNASFSQSIGFLVTEI
jgi:hypothetical protein